MDSRFYNINNRKIKVESLCMRLEHIDHKQERWVSFKIFKNCTMLYQFSGFLLLKTHLNSLQKKEENSTLILHPTPSPTSRGKRVKKKMTYD